jgi:hypothetical protein
MKTHLCRFSALDDLPMKLRSDGLEVLRLLAEVGRFSCFEVDNQLASSLQQIKRHDWAKFDKVGYPWTTVTLTDAGRAALKVP